MLSLVNLIDALSDPLAWSRLLVSSSPIPSPDIACESKISSGLERNSYKFVEDKCVKTKWICGEEDMRTQSELLHHKIRYHLKEWASGSSRPQTKQEFFNFSHATLWNVIERSFGAIKKTLTILKTIGSASSREYFPFKVGKTRVTVSARTFPSCTKPWPRGPQSI